MTIAVDLGRKATKQTNKALEILEKRQPIHWFRFTELNKTMGIVCGRNSSETSIEDEVL